MKKSKINNQKHIIERKPEIVARHIHAYGPSLSNYIDRYAHLFFNSSEASQIPPHPTYLCPLCLEKGILLLKDGFADNGADFTQDHFPPKNVGGTRTMLVCRKCNSEAGLFENGLKQKLQDRSFDNGVPNSQRNIRSSISTIQGNYPGTLTMGENDKINISFKENESMHAPILDDWLARPVVNPDWTAEVTYFVADQKKVTKSILKTAYLYCFQYWGYAFCYSKTAELIREVLNDKATYPTENLGFWLTEKIGDINIPMGLCTLAMPRDLKTFCVNVLLTDLNTKHQDVFCIIVPGPFQQNWDQLKAIEQLVKDDPNFDIALKHVEGCSVMDNQYDGYIASWNLFTNNP